MSFGMNNNNNPNNDYIVNNPPSDGVSSLSFSPNSDILGVTSWDNSVMCYQVQLNNNGGLVDVQPAAKIDHEAPPLDCDFNNDGSILFSAGCDRIVKAWQLAGNQQMTIGQHDAPIRKLQYIPEINMVATGSWDNTVRFWDMRQQEPAAVLQLPERCYAMDIKHPLMVVVTADRQVIIFDMSSGSPNEYRRMESPLKYQCRDVSCFTEKTGFAMTSIEGRVAIQYVNDPPKNRRNNNKDENFVFKTHRQNENGKSRVYPINSVEFHMAGTFATAGGDGGINYWDKGSRQRTKMFNRNQMPISAAKFSPPGNLYAYATCYDWSQGAANFPSNNPVNIFLHQVQPDEVRPRKKK